MLCVCCNLLYNNLNTEQKKHGGMMDSNYLPIKNGITIPLHELEITASRAGGPGGQHVNKTSTAVMVRWNIKNTSALNEIQKERVMNKLQSRLTSDGDLIIRNSSARSQQQNKEMALKQLASVVAKALHVPKKRVATKISKAKKELNWKAVKGGRGCMQVCSPL